jgi:3D (Asp-Asp-Asp) domain-containing protein
MPKVKNCVSWKRLRLIRILVIVVGFGSLVHLNRRECARVTDKSIAYRSSSTEMMPVPFGMESFHATAYCITGITKSGVRVAPGHVAADPKVIPLGSMIYVDAPLMGGGIYQVLDTGNLVKGKIIDIFIPSYNRCQEFGRRMVKVKVLRYGYLNNKSENHPIK